MLGSGPTFSTLDGEKVVKVRIVLASSALVLPFAASQAVAAQWNFTWSGWIGDNKRSNSWDAGAAGTHVWTKQQCIPSGSQDARPFSVEIRRHRTLQPDYSLGIRTLTCNNNNQSRNFPGPASGSHHFRFRDVGNTWISGEGRVNYPG